MSIDDLLEKGSSAFESGDFIAAIQFYQKALEQQKSAEIWGFLAEAQVENGAFTNAYKSLRAGLELEPENIELLFVLGDLYLEDEKPVAAIDIYQKIVNLEPDEIDAWVSMVLAHAGAGDLDAAAKTCRNVLERTPDSVFALNALGDIYAQQDNFDEALHYFNQAVLLDPDDPQSYLSIAELYYDKGELQQAEEHVLKGLSLDAGMATGYLTMGYICLDQDLTQAAIDNFQQFLQLEKSPAAKAIRDEVLALIDGLK